MKRLRAEVAELRRANEILTTASAFFAARLDGGADGCVHHSDHSSQYISLANSTHVADAGMLPSTGTVGDSYDSALAARTNNTYKRELIWANKPYRSMAELEYATMRWVSWYNTKHLHASLG
ncbi:integrase core domain-containing protein [Bifidobacterium sp. 82T24]|nr:integrase core domain-containing protein [Bifidobacterium pluvialisilvae]